MKHVLIIEEDPGVRKRVKQALEGKYRITEATSGEDAIGSLPEQYPDLILMPEVISGGEGLKLLEALQKQPGMHDIPALFLISRRNAALEQRAFDQGAADIINLPCSDAVIMNRVSTQLELKEYRASAMEYNGYQDAISVSIAELVECRDVTTGGHLKNTTAYFKILLEEVISREEYRGRIPKEDVRDLIRSAPLHDIGKIGINDEILRKASALDYNEFEYMKTHTILAKETFDKIMKETGETRFLTLARDLAYCHHERWDGTGYPNGLKGEEIPFYARILAIADVYDALTSHRTYKKAFTHRDALEIIRQGKGTLFDPELVEVFAGINDKFEQALSKKYRNGAEQ